jgi:H+-transporting ATPase
VRQGMSLREEPSRRMMRSAAGGCRGAITGTVLTFVGLPGLIPLPWWQMLAVFFYAMVSCLVPNDAAKVAMIKWRVLNAVARKSVDVPASAKG